MSADMQNPGVQAGASRNRLGSRLHPSHTLSAYRAQHLISTYAMRPELAALVASLAFGGGARHG